MRTLRQLAKESRNRFRAGIESVNLKSRNPIIVYQMGKVGSSSVVSVLQSLNVSVPVLQLHTLNADHAEDVILRTRESVNPVIPQHLFLSLNIAPIVRHGDLGCRIVTLTREPISRAISFVFEDWVKQAPAAKSGKDLDVDMIKESVTKLLSGENAVADPTCWFESELKRYFGIDVFSKPYDHERGFMNFQREGISVLLIRLEDMDRALTQGLSELLGHPVGSLRVSRSNIGSKKWYSKSMAQVKETLKLPEPVVEKVLATCYAQHFYAFEADAIRARWIR